jgi:hypothetical protein
MGGSDDIDNAAPLCQNCHARYGANPEKRTEIRQMRDWWYDVVKEKYHGDQSQFKKLDDALLQIREHQESSKAEMDKFRNDYRGGERDQDVSGTSGGATQIRAGE